MNDKQILELQRSVHDISTHTKQVLGSRLATAVNNGDLKVPKEELSKLVSVVNAIVDEAYLQAAPGFHSQIGTLKHLTVVKPGTKTKKD